MPGGKRRGSRTCFTRSPAVHAGRRRRAATLTTPAPELWDGVDVRKEVDRILLSKYSPAGVVVDEDLEVLEIRGKASPYLTLPVGKVSFNLMKLIPDTGLFLEVEKLIQQARQSGEPARQERVPYEHDGSAGGLNVEVVPLDSSQKRSTLVLFEPVPGAAGREAEPPDAPPEGDIRDRQISRLKQQLADAKERFLSAIEAHQTSREESQNTTEEALSANEELQSLNEELETAKEELQSTNEELITVNDELQAKNAALAQARDFAMSIVETVRQPLLVLDTDLRIRMANRAFYRTFQTSPLEAEGQVIYSLSRGSWDLPGLRDSLDGLLQGGNSFPDFEVEQDFPAVGRRNLVLGGCRINHLKMILLAVDDITERKLAQQALRKSEEHLRQSQKMEAVGRLAGGIAHDFNNLLTAIIGYSSLLYDTLAGNEPAIQQVLEIKTAGERAASLTQQLLAFSRRQVLQPKVLDLNAIVADFDRMLRRLVGERIKVAIDCEPALWQVRADPGEIGRAIMNLSLNARDAMPDGGTLTIETANVTLTEADAAERGPCAGPLRDDGRARHRRRHGRGDAGAYLRAVLHDERDRQRNWPGPRHRSGNCRAKRRRHPLRVANRARERPSESSCRQSPRRWTRERVRPEALPSAPKGSEVILAGGGRRRGPQACPDDSGDERLRGSRSPQRTRRSGAVRSPPGPNRSAGDRCGHAGTRRTPTRRRRPQAAARP